MNTSERQKKILKILQDSEVPVTAKDLAACFKISRQVIVQDIAVIRAATAGIISTCRGYTMEKANGFTREFKVCHTDELTARELNLIVDCGGTVRNVSINHRVYGRITVDMDIRSRQDVEDLLKLLHTGKSTLLANAAAGYHYHVVEAATKERLDMIGERLKEANLIAPLTAWEKEAEGATGK